MWPGHGNFSDMGFGTMSGVVYSQMAAAAAMSDMLRSTVQNVDLWTPKVVADPTPGFDKEELKRRTQESAAERAAALEAMEKAAAQAEVERVAAQRAVTDRAAAQEAAERAADREAEDIAVLQQAEVEKAAAEQAAAAEEAAALAEAAVDEDTDIAMPVDQLEVMLDAARAAATCNRVAASPLPGESGVGQRRRASASERRSRSQRCIAAQSGDRGSHGRRRSRNRQDSRSRQRSRSCHEHPGRGRSRRRAKGKDIRAPSPGRRKSKWDVTASDRSKDPHPKDVPDWLQDLADTSKADKPEPTWKNYKVLRLQAVQIRCLLGKGGETIREVRARSGADIKINHPPQDPEGDISIVGDVERTEAVIREVLAHKGCPIRTPTEEPPGWPPGTSSSFSSSPSSAPPPPLRDAEHEEHVQIPSGIVGLFIGSGGANIRDIKAQLGGATFISVQPASDAGDPYQTVRIVGENREKAKLLVRAKIQEIQKAPRPGRPAGRGRGDAGASGAPPPPPPPPAAPRAPPAPVGGPPPSPQLPAVGAGAGVGRGDAGGPGDSWPRMGEMIGGAMGGAMCGMNGVFKGDPTGCMINETKGNMRGGIVADSWSCGERHCMMGGKGGIIGGITGGGRPSDMMGGGGPPGTGTIMGSMMGWNGMSWDGWTG